MAKVIVLDLEMNPGGSGKIIQIGYVIADLRLNKILRKRSLIVNPNESLEIIPGLTKPDGTGVHISEYTGITEDMIKLDGRSLLEAYDILCMDVAELNPTRTCVQWGDGGENSKGDHDYLRRELGVSWSDFLFRSRAWDVKSQFQIYRAFNNDSVAMGLGKALESLGMVFIGNQHDAMADAENTYRLFVELGSKAVKYDKIKKLL